MQRRVSAGWRPTPPLQHGLPLHEALTWVTKPARPPKLCACLAWGPATLRLPAASPAVARASVAAGAGPMTAYRWMVDPGAGRHCRSTARPRHRSPVRQACRCRGLPPSRHPDSPSRGRTSRRIASSAHSSGHQRLCHRASTPFVSGDAPGHVGAAPQRHSRRGWAVLHRLSPPRSCLRNVSAHVVLLLPRTPRCDLPARPPTWHRVRTRGHRPRPRRPSPDTNTRSRPSRCADGVTAAGPRPDGVPPTA